MVAEARRLEHVDAAVHTPLALVRCFGAVRAGRPRLPLEACRSGGGNDGSRATNTGAGGGEFWATGTAATSRGDVPVWTCFFLGATGCAGVAPSSSEPSSEAGSASASAGPSMGRPSFSNKTIAEGKGCRRRTCVQPQHATTDWGSKGQAEPGGNNAR